MVLKNEINLKWIYLMRSLSKLFDDGESLRTRTAKKFPVKPIIPTTVIATPSTQNLFSNLTILIWLSLFNEIILWQRETDNNNRLIIISELTPTYIMYAVKFGLVNWDNFDPFNWLITLSVIPWSSAHCFLILTYVCFVFIFNKKSF